MTWRAQAIACVAMWSTRRLRRPSVSGIWTQTAGCCVRRLSAACSGVLIHCQLQLQLHCQKPAAAPACVHDTMCWHFLALQ